MKQKIKTSQIDNLSDKGKQKLYDWWNKDLRPGPQDWTTGCQWNKPIGDNLVESCYLPYLTIGEMIEFLVEHNERWRLECVTVSENPCDDLWHNVKEILEK